MAKLKHIKPTIELVTEQAERFIEQTESTINTGLVMFRFNRNVNVGGTLVQAGASLEIELLDAKAFKVIGVGEIVKVGE